MEQKNYLYRLWRCHTWLQQRLAGWRCIRADNTERRYRYSHPKEKRVDYHHIYDTQENWKIRKVVGRKQYFIRPYKREPESTWTCKRKNHSRCVPWWPGYLFQRTVGFMAYERYYRVWALAGTTKERNRATCDIWPNRRWYLVKRQREKNQTSPCLADKVWGCINWRYLAHPHV